PVGCGQQRGVSVARGLVAERLYEPALPGRTREQVFGADNPCHTHQGVVNADGKLVGEDAVRAAYDEVPTIVGQILSVFAQMPVYNRDILIRYCYFVGRGPLAIEPCG